MRNRWLRAIQIAKNMNIMALHILREGKCVASTQASSTQGLNCLTSIPSSLASLAYRDHMDLVFYRSPILNSD